MDGPTEDELVFTMSNNMKTKVKFATENKHGKVIRTAAKFLPRSTLKRKANAKVMVQTSEEKISGSEGLCAALSAMYLLKSYELGLATKRADVEQSFKVQIAQSAFQQWERKDYSAKRERLLDMMGLNTAAKGVNIPLGETMAHVADNAGRYMVALRYASGGGHMVAFRNAGYTFYYFEPERGLYRFNSRKRFLEAMSEALLASGSLTHESTSSWWKAELQG